MFALDTNTFIYFFKGAGRVAERLLSTPPAEIAIPSIVLFELEIGIANSNQPERRRAQLGDMLSVISVLPFDEKAARVTASLQIRLQRSGRPIGPLDALIAGTALANGATLVTHNVKEFERVEGLLVEDWY